ncbi:MAG: hypothetical protein HC918_02915 [Oscillatoriales cyanobacterium SM2_1_8]|nr:hypothetical protein [Oscillatoriales cyanobacterium SM2_1_8]
MVKIKRDRLVWTLEHTPLKAWLWGAAILVWWPALFFYGTFGYVTTRQVLACDRTQAVTCRVFQRNAAGVTIDRAATLSGVSGATVQSRLIEDEDGDYTIYEVLVQHRSGGYPFPDLRLRNGDRAQAIAADINVFVNNRFAQTWEYEFLDFSTLTGFYVMGMCAFLFGGPLLLLSRRVRITCDRARGEIRFEGRSLIFGKYGQTVKFHHLKLMVREVKDSYDNTQGYEAIAELPELSKPNGGFAQGFTELTRSQKPRRSPPNTIYPNCRNFSPAPSIGLGCRGCL